MIETIKSFLSALLLSEKREDGRNLLDYRDIKVEVNPIARANGSARVKIGDTEVLVGIKMDAKEPFPDTPAEGVLMVMSELLPMASPDFEPGPPSPESVELARVCDRAIRESHMLDLSKLCITPKEKVWCVNVDIYPVNDAGNLLDASLLAAVVALKNARFCGYNAETGEVLYKELTKEKLPVSETPILATFAKLNGKIFIDPSRREEKAFDARLSIATKEDGEVCAMQKGGPGTFTEEEVLSCIELASEKGKELRKLVEK
jgi:exosome complex component RRP42